MRTIAWGLIAAILVLDQLTKWIMLRFVFAIEVDPTPSLWHPPIVVTDFFNLVLVWNRGASFGLFNTGDQWVTYALTALAVVVSVALVIWIYRATHWLTVIALASIVGGAIGNAIDRVRIGAVMDFLDFHAFGYHWPAFNVADSAIVLGVGVLLFDSFFGRPAPAQADEGR